MISGKRSALGTFGSNLATGATVELLMEGRNGEFFRMDFKGLVREAAFLGGSQLAGGPGSIT